MTRYVIETRDAPKAKWSRGKVLVTYETREKAQEIANELDMMGGCGPIRVVEYDPAKHR
jgi:hypothetical protein